MPAKTRLLIASLLVSLLLLHLVEADPTVSSNPLQPQPQPQKIDCGGACEARCKLSSRPNLCKRACGSCCDRCNCVPPGTARNKNLCPCYASLTTRGGLPKCP